jgi:autotransporter-associated beta strand protein
MIEGGVHTNAADTSLCSGANSRAYFTMEGGEYVNLRPANPNRANTADSLTVINLNGGVFAAWSVAKARKSYPDGVVAGAYINFNGGAFFGNKAGYSIFGIPGGENWEAAVDRVTVYERGAVIDVARGITQYVDVPLSAPTGNGVASVDWLDTGVSYVGSPVVEIIGDGTGASAFAEFDSVRREVTGIKITSPGCDYTWAKAVIRYGNEAPVTNAAVKLAKFKSGSFTKKGVGTLVLNAPNSYGGDTVVENGTLLANVAGAIPEGSRIVFKGGRLNVADGVVLPAATFGFDLLKPVAYPGAFEFPAGSKVEIANLEKAEKAAGSYEIVTFDGGLSGAVPEISNKDDLPPRWNLIKSGKSLKLRYSRGTVVSFR